MKSFKTIIIIFLACSSILGQSTVEWSKLDKNPNPLDINTYIKFINNGEIKNSSNVKLFDIKNGDSIQIVKADPFATILFKENVIKINMIFGQFQLHFGNQIKAFKFDDRDNKSFNSNRLGKSNITLSTPYYNAYQIYEFYSAGKFCQVNQILDKLNINEDTDNQLLKELRKSCTRESSTSTNINTNNVLSSIGGFDVTRYADGLAKFLVKRAKEELTISFFEKFKRELEAQPDVRILFPATFKVLGRIEEIYDYSRYLNLLRESYQQDFNNFPDSVDKLISGKPDIDQKYKAGVHLSSKIIQGLRDKTHPGKILASMNANVFDSLHVDVNNSFIISQTLSEALRDTFSGTNMTYWVDGSKILELSQNNELLKIFIGLTIEKLREKNLDLFTKLNDVAKVDSYTPIISEISQLTQGISSLVKANQSNGSINNEDISRYIDYSLKLFKVSRKILDTFHSTTQATSNDFDKALSILEISNSLYADIATQKYSSALFNFMELIDLIPNLNKDNKISWLMKYGSFMAESIAAENSDEVAKVIETYAMPSGSSRVKRNSDFNISLNSYVGLYTGIEDGKSVFGIAAPVGIAFSHGWKKGSISLFLTAIDIGAISSFRFNNEDDEVAKIYLREIISPGAFISYGFGQSPISINFGWQRAPLLKRVGPSQNEVNLEHNARFSLSVLVDLPLFNLYNKAK